MSKSTKSTKSVKSEVVKTESRYAVHYARLRELQAERKAKRDQMIAKIEAAQQEYREYLKKYEAGRKESETNFNAAKKERVKAETKVENKKTKNTAAKKTPAKSAA